MSAAAEAGFGEVDQDLEQDFAAFLQPKGTKSSTTSKAGATAATPRKSPQRGKKAAQRPRSATSAPEAVAEAPKAVPDSADRSEGRKRPRRGRPPGTATGSGSGAALVLWTPVEIRSRMQRVRNETGKKYADQVLDALEATIDELPDLIASASNTKTVKGPLFERTVVEPKPEVVSKQLTIPGLTASQIAVIDELVDSTGAGSRSKLVNVALDHALPNAGQSSGG